MDADAERARQVGYFVGTIVGGAFVGLICGLLPFYLGRSRGRAGLGQAGLALCTVAGLLLGLLGAVPMAVLMAIVILVAGRPAKNPRSSSGPKYRTPTPGPVDF